MGKFPKEIQDFANHLIQMQSKRHDADYDPFKRNVKSLVTADIELSEQAIENYRKTNTSDRRAFCIWIMLSNRN